MDARRREVLKTGGGVLALAAAAGIIRPGVTLAQEWNKAAFETRSVAETVKALGGGGSTPSGAIEITAPDIAENGAVVPIAVESKLPRTQAIAILIEKNPNTLSAEFEIPAGTWEEVVLPSRVAGYRSDWLDQLCLSGELAWGRLRVRDDTGEEGAAALEDLPRAPAAHCWAATVTLVMVSPT